MQLCLVGLLISIFLSSCHDADSARSTYGPRIPNQDKDRIIGGEEVVPGRYPYMVHLYSNFLNMSSCSGTLIHPDWVLTTSKCHIYAHDIAQIGRFDVSSGSIEAFETIEIEFYVIHPDFDNDFDHNYMLYKLKTSSKATTVALDDGSASLVAGTNATVMGWGYSNRSNINGGLESELLREVDLEIVENSDCQWSFQVISIPITDTMICASRFNLGPVGDRDNGGPLIIKGENASSDIQVGITLGWKLEGRPALFSRVGSAVEFINDTISCSTGTDNLNECCGVKCENGVFSCVRSTFPDHGFNYSDCTDEPACWIGDGFCDFGDNFNFNYAACNYDGGDCCQETCVNGFLSCGSSQAFEDSCIDPEYEKSPDFIEILQIILADFFLKIFDCFNEAKRIPWMKWDTNT